MKLSARFEASSTSARRSTKSATTQTGSRHQGNSESAPSPAARNLALAHHIERLIETGIIADYTQAARMLGVSQPRMSQLMNLILLASSIQEAILTGKAAPKDKELRALARIAEWETQVKTLQVTYAAAGHS